MEMNTFLSETIEKVPVLSTVKRKTFNFIRRNYVLNQDINDKLSIFSPFSGNPVSLVTKLTFLSANQTLPLLRDLMVQTTGRKPLEVSLPDAFVVGAEEKESAENLATLFNKYGSDKAKTHNYHLIYGSILKNRTRVERILEIGLGTNNTDVVSNMGRNGKPGASLRAFREFLPNAQIFGADFDKRILFDEERIKTFFVDQTDLETFKTLGKNIGNEFDLIIDDGLHSPNANLAVLLFAMEKLKKDGWIVIEDVRQETLPIWQIVAEFLSKTYQSHFINARGAYVFAAKKLQ
jgi:hypothetical protein